MNAIYGAGVTGEAVLYACQQKNIYIDSFCDDDTHIVGNKINNVPILKLSQIESKSAHFIIATTEIEDVINKLRLGTSWESCVDILNNFDTNKHHFSKTNDFAQYVIDTCISCHQAYQNPNKLFIRSIDLVITEKCSLKCKDCSNLMPYYKKPSSYITQFLYESIDRICDITDQIHEFRIIGGEPLLHKDHHKIVDYILNKDVNRVVIYTNGTINIPKHKIQQYKNKKVVFFITDYGKLSMKIKQLEQMLKQNNITYYISPVGGWADCSKIVSHDRGLYLFKNCCVKNTFTLLGGMFYRCPFSANAIHIGLIEDYNTDFCDIFNITKQNLKSFIYNTNQSGIQSCNCCNGRSYGAPEIEAAIQI